MTDDTPTAGDATVDATDDADDDGTDAPLDDEAGVDSDPQRADAPLDPRDQRAVVRERYGAIATGSDSGCCGSGADSGTSVDAESCCDTGVDASSDTTRADATDTDACCTGDDADRLGELGYSEADRALVEDGAVPGLGCGNPTAIAGLEPGEDVLDLGSGGGFDCRLAAREVGPDGSVVGVDMTPEMVEKARESVTSGDADDSTPRDGETTSDDATTSDLANVEFRLGEIEYLPVADESVDVVLSNCVVNLSPDKRRVFRETFRVLRPGGRLAISDVVLTAEPPADLRADPDSVAACVAGAAPVPALEAMLADAGFEAISVAVDAGSESVVREWDADHDPSDFVVAATIEAEKPAASGRCTS